MKFNQEDHRIHARIDATLPSNDEKLAMIATLLGMSGVLVEFINDSYDLEELPIIVRYSIAMIAGNLMAFMSGQKVSDIFHFPTDTEIDLGEQLEEKVYRKMKIIIKMLHDQIEKEEQ